MEDKRGLIAEQLQKIVLKNNGVSECQTFIWDLNVLAFMTEL